VMLLFLLSLSFAVWDDDAVFVMMVLCLQFLLGVMRRGAPGRTSKHDDAVCLGIYPRGE